VWLAAVLYVGETPVALDEKALAFPHGLFLMTASDPP